MHRLLLRRRRAVHPAVLRATRQHSALLSRLHPESLCGHGGLSAVPCIDALSPCAGAVVVSGQPRVRDADPAARPRIAAEHSAPEPDPETAFHSDSTRACSHRGRACARGSGAEPFCEQRVRLLARLYPPVEIWQARVVQGEAGSQRAPWLFPDGSSSGRGRGARRARAADAVARPCRAPICRSSHFVEVGSPSRSCSCRRAYISRSGRSRVGRILPQLHGLRGCQHQRGRPILRDGPRPAPWCISLPRGSGSCKGSSACAARLTRILQWKISCVVVAGGVGMIPRWLGLFELVGGAALRILLAQVASVCGLWPRVAHVRGRSL